jgi:hypothetical protein
MKQAALAHVMQNDADDESPTNAPHAEGHSQQEHNCLEMHRPRIEIYADLCRHYQAVLKNSQAAVQWHSWDKVLASGDLEERALDLAKPNKPGPDASLCSE